MDDCLLLNFLSCANLSTCSRDLRTSIICPLCPASKIRQEWFLVCTRVYVLYICIILYTHTYMCIHTAYIRHTCMQTDKKHDNIVNSIYITVILSSAALRMQETSLQCTVQPLLLAASTASSALSFLSVQPIYIYLLQCLLILHCNFYTAMPCYPNGYMLS